MNSRLTLDYGVRFVHQQPQYDTLGQASNFLPDKWTLGAAPMLYVAGLRQRRRTRARARNRQAMNPVTGPVPRAEHARWRSARSCPNTGNTTNGLFLPGRASPKTTYTWPALGVAPRFGMAYDVTGQQTLRAARRRRAVLRSAERQLDLRAASTIRRRPATSRCGTGSCRRSAAAA